MENCDQESERRQVDASGLKLFLSRIYEYMALAVFISATSAYLTMTFLLDHLLALLRLINGKCGC